MVVRIAAVTSMSAGCTDASQAKIREFTRAKGWGIDSKTSCAYTPPIHTHKHNPKKQPPPKNRPKNLSLVNAAEPRKEFCCTEGPGGKAYTFYKGGPKATANFNKAKYANNAAGAQV